MAVIGSNGAGKTTLFRAICGLLAAITRRACASTARAITGGGPTASPGAGSPTCPPSADLFPQMTVDENLDLGAYPAAPRRRRAGRSCSTCSPGSAERRRQRAGTMSGGEQQMLAVGRALMSKPRVLMLDEPTTGLAPKLAAEAYARARRPARSTA